MTTATMPRLMTAKEFAIMPHDDDMRRELVDGELIELPPSPMPSHGNTQSNASRLLGNFARPRSDGIELTEVGFLISRNPDTVRLPDVAFVSAERLPQGGGLPSGYFPFAPDIAVEVVSPSATRSETHERALMWLDAGSALVWMMFPDSRSVTVYRPDGGVTALGEDDVLDAAPVLDGFSVKVSEFFDMFG